MGLIPIKSAPLDVFICTTGARVDCYARTLAAWAAADWAGRKITVLPREGDPLRDFDRHRRAEAEALARSYYYVLTDDDIVPENIDYITVAIAAMDRHPEIGMLAAWLTNEPLDASTLDHEGIWYERCGGLRLIRRNAVTFFPAVEHPRGAYDDKHAELMRANGYKTGWLRPWRAEHIGKGRSEVWSDWPNRPGDRPELGQ